MKRISAIAILLSLLVPGARAGAQGPDGEALRERREKLRKILTVRDLRTPHDAALYRYLYDPDTLVRETATIAFGSLQDTAALTDLVNNLTDGPPSVRRAAAFAIGQTGPMLSERGREDLAHELIWIRSERLRDRGYLIEEIGKFGDLQALTDLMLKFGTDPEVGREHLFMSIARFGIRGVVASEAIQVLLGHVKTASPVSWRSVYALQRIGDHEEIRIEAEDLVPLTRDPDPLVRLNAAALFGKLAPDGRVVEPLLRLADFDRDWRVRVNALRALGNFPPSTEIVETFRRAFVDPDLHIALTAINAFAGSATKDTGDGVVGGTAVAEIGRMARNEENGYRWQLQSAAAQALARITGERALELIRPRGNEEPLLLAGLITAMGSTGSPAAAMTLLGYEGAGEPLLRRSSLEALMEIARGRSAGAGLLDTVYGASIRGLESGDMAVVTVAAANLGDSLLLRRGSVGPLTAALDGLEAPGDIEAMQEICRTIGRIGDPATIPSLEKYLTHRDAALARAAAGALSVLTGRDESGRIPAEREPLHVDLDFAYLEDLPDTVGMVLETIHGDIRIDLYPRVAPFTVMTILKLAVNEGFYDGLIFHRVVPNFVVQGGDPRGDGWGGPGYSVRSEFSPLGYGTGTVGIASAGKDTEGSQFFITHSPQPHLDGRYTIIGRVVSGMPAVDALQVGDRIMDFRRVR